MLPLLPWYDWFEYCNEMGFLSEEYGFSMMHMVYDMVIGLTIAHNDQTELVPDNILRCRSAYVTYLCGTMGPWVKVPKALKEDTLVWVYGVGPTPR